MCNGLRVDPDVALSFLAPESRKDWFFLVRHVQRDWPGQSDNHGESRLLTLVTRRASQAVVPCQDRTCGATSDCSGSDFGYCLHGRLSHTHPRRLCDDSVASNKLVTSRDPKRSTVARSMVDHVLHCAISYSGWGSLTSTS